MGQLSVKRQLLVLAMEKKKSHMTIILSAWAGIDPLANTYGPVSEIILGSCSTKASVFHLIA